jgi:hypothetical protein
VEHDARGRWPGARLFLEQFQSNKPRSLEINQIFFFPFYWKISIIFLKK